MGRMWGIKLQFGSIRRIRACLACIGIGDQVVNPVHRGRHAGGVLHRVGRIVELASWGPGQCPRRRPDPKNPAAGPHPVRSSRQWLPGNWQRCSYRRVKRAPNPARQDLLLELAHRDVVVVGGSPRCFVHHRWDDQRRDVLGDCSGNECPARHTPGPGRR